MTAEEYKSALRTLGLDYRTAAKALGVGLRTSQRYGRYGAPQYIALALEAIAKHRADEQPPKTASRIHGTAPRSQERKEQIKELRRQLNRLPSDEQEDLEAVLQFMVERTLIRYANEQLRERAR